MHAWEHMNVNAHMNTVYVGIHTVDTIYMVHCMQKSAWHSSRTLGSHDTLHELSHSRHCILSALHAKKRIKALHAHINALQTSKRTRSYSESRSESVCASLQTYTCVCVCVCVCVCTRTHKCTHTQNTPWGLYTTRMCCMLVGLFCKC
jgi:hypothetical protein